MLRIVAITKKLELKMNLSLNDLNDDNLLWYWVDFNSPSEEEAFLLESYFNFHPLAIEDCLHFLQRPKFDHYDNYTFFVLHSLNKNNLLAQELDIFLGSNYLVSFHLTSLIEIDEVWDKLSTSKKDLKVGSIHIAYLIFDKLVDHYFPAVYDIEDYLNELDENRKGKSIKFLIDEIFVIRSKLLKLRRIVTQMRDLLYRILSSNELTHLKEKHAYFSDIYDHLLKLSEMLEASQAVTSEMRDNYLSINSNRMNSIMMLLTVVTSIFIPLTFIVGIYGMNFKYMPELEWKYGYFFIMLLMSFIALTMFLWFKRKGWFNFYNK